MKYSKTYLSLGAFLMAMAVILGALGAHSLEAVLDADQLDSFKTGVRYQAWHAIALLIVQLIPVPVVSEKARRSVSILFLLGTFFFSFSIYLLSLRDLIGISSWKAVLGPITPIGGLLLIAGWMLLAIGILSRKSVS